MCNQRTTPKDLDMHFVLDQSAQSGNVVRALAALLLDLHRGEKVRHLRKTGRKHELKEDSRPPQ
jgi:hypothetical protein